MIVFAIYFSVICFLIYKNGLFGILKDDILNSKLFLFAFILKTIALGLVGLIYFKMYGRIDYLDAGNFFHDSKVIHDISHSNFLEFTKVMFGLQDESINTELFRDHIIKTVVWDKNPEEFFYNDNRIIIRLHALIHFISFNNYFVHGLFSALISLIGGTWIYKVFKFLFPRKELLLFLCWLIFPGLLFWTSGLFKEAPALFLMGLLLFSLKKIIIEHSFNLKKFILLCIAGWLSFLLKPYVLVPVLIISLLFFTIYSLKNIKYRSLIFISGICGLLLLGNFALRAFTSQSILSLVSQRQFTFIDMSHGGLFLLNNERYVRLPFDYSLVDTLRGRDSVIIKKGAGYIYWEHSHQKDTLAVTANSDTVGTYQLYNILPPANSTIDIPLINNSYLVLLKIIPVALYITLFKPFFFDSRNMMDLMASVENLIIAISLLLLLISFIKTGFKNPWSLYFLSITFSVLLLIGITSPNIGAIERYRSLAIPFLLMAVVLGLKTERFEQNKVSIFFKRSLLN